MNFVVDIENVFYCKKQRNVFPWFMAAAQAPRNRENGV